MPILRSPNRTNDAGQKYIISKYSVSKKAKTKTVSRTLRIYAERARDPPAG